MKLDCETCKTPMTKTGTLNSGNSTFHEFLCKNCNQKKTACLGTNE